MSQPDQNPAKFPVAPRPAIDETRSHSGAHTEPSSVEAGPGQASAPLPNIPGYVVENFVASGGQGEVYRARHLKLDRLVALKLLRRAVTDPDELARFTREGKLAAKLDHPNFIRIFDYSEHDGRLYFAMEFAEGGSLKDRLAAGPLAPRAAAELLASLADAVHHAHELGVIHRDLKPGNVFFNKAGTPKVADFGLAKQLNADSADLTRDQSVLGSARYMAPEQAAGKSKQVNASTDVYALGNILYECLCGVPPFDGEDWLEILIRIRTEAIPSLDAKMPGVPPILRRICARCLEKDPAGRYVSAAELAADLRAFLDDSNVSAAPPVRPAAVPVSKPTKVTADESEPPRLPGYEILERIGRGAVGAVYKARQTSLDRIVAVKTIALTAANRDRWTPCQDEIRRIVGLTHPNLVHVFDLGQIDGQAFVISEYLPGGTLAQRSHGPSVSCRQAVQCVEQMSLAVAAAHRLGIVHRDLRPSNLLYASPGSSLDDTAKVGDFGLALLETPGMAGNARAMNRPMRAPELQADLAAPATPAADVFALGVVLFELLTGRAPGLGVSDALQLLKPGQSGSVVNLPAAPSEHRDDVPAALDAICLKALQPDPTRRYPSAAEWAVDLRRFLDGKTPHAQGRSVWDRLLFWR